MMRTILLVEDNAHILKINRALLEKAGHRVMHAQTVAAARALIKKKPPDLLVLDIMLPDGDGIALCRELRAPQSASSALPILLLSAKGRKDDVVAGLRAGGDDYLPKPYHLSVLLARVEALLRRAGNGWQPVQQTPEGGPFILKHGPLTLEVAAMRALVHGNDILLTPKEFLVLLALWENEGQVLDKEALYLKVWGQAMGGDSQALYATVSRLKRKLEPFGGVRLVAVRSGGYRLEIENQT